MPRNCGRTMLLYIENASSPGTYDLIGGMQANTFSVNKEAVEVTDKQSGSDKVLADCGIRSASISGNGVFDTALGSLIRVLTSLLGIAPATTAIFNFRVTFGGGTTIESITGPFLISSFERNGEYNGAEMFSIALESAGALTYVARVA